MKERIEQIEGRLREKLDGFEMTPPDGVWNSIIENRNSQSKIIAWPIWIASLFFFLLIASIVLLNIRYKLPILPNTKQVKTTYPVSFNKKEAFFIEAIEYATIKEEKLVLKTTNSSTDFWQKNSPFQKIRPERTIKLKPHTFNQTASLRNWKKLSLLAFFKRPNFSELHQNYWKQSPLLFDRMKAKPTINNFSISVSAGPSSFKYVALKKEEQAFHDFIQSVRTNPMGFSIGAQVKVALSDDVGVYSGIDYSHLAEDLTWTTESQLLKTVLDTIGHEIDSLTGDTIYDIKETTETHIKHNHHAVRNTYQILSIPFGLSFNKRFNTKHEIEMDLGGKISLLQASSGQFIQNQEGVFISNQEAMKTRGVISLASSVKYLYSPVKHHYLFAEPWFDLTLNSIAKPVVGPPRQMLRYGLKIGYRIQF